MPTASHYLIQPNRPVRRDLLLMVVSLVAFTGGVLVFRSFAGTHAETTVPGHTIPASQIHQTPIIDLHPTSDTYQFDIKSGLRYCFWGRHANGTSISLVVLKQSLKIEQTLGRTTPTDEPLVCFTAASDLSQAKVELSHHGDLNVQSLRTSQP